MTATRAREAGAAHQRDLVREVEIGHRVVEEQHLPQAVCPASLELREGAGELHPLLLAARQRLVAAGRQMGDFGGIQRVSDDALAHRPGEGAPDAVDADSHHFGHGEGEGDAARLRHHRALRGELPGRYRRQEFAVQADGAGRGRQFAGQKLRQCRLAGAVRADHDEDLAGSDTASTGLCRP